MTDTEKALFSRAKAAGASYIRYLLSSLRLHTGYFYFYIHGTLVTLSCTQQSSFQTPKSHFFFTNTGMLYTLKPDLLQLNSRLKLQTTLPLASPS